VIRVKYTAFGLGKEKLGEITLQWVKYGLQLTYITSGDLGMNRINSLGCLADANPKFRWMSYSEFGCTLIHSGYVRKLILRSITLLALR